MAVPDGQRRSLCWDNSDGAWFGMAYCICWHSYEHYLNTTYYFVLAQCVRRAQVLLKWRRDFAVTL